MSTGIILGIAAAFLVVAFLIWRTFGVGYFRARGKRLVTCPENEQTVAVEVDARHAALTGATGRPHLRLTECTRWPEKQGCGQQCLRQIENSPDGCLVRNFVAEFYAGKACVLCGRDLTEKDWLEHGPAFRAPDRVTVEARFVAAENLPEILKTHSPVCWDCHIAETFRAKRPDLVVERPRPVSN